MGLLDSLIPTPAKLYWDSVVAGRKDPITESDFSPDELAVMRKMIGNKTQGGITYADYDPSAQPGLSGLLTPAGRVVNSLGQFTYDSDPGGTTVTDAYDFNPVYKDESLLLKAMQILGTGGFAGLHMIGEDRLPPGSGRQVKIRLPKR